MVFTDTQQGSNKEKRPHNVRSKSRVWGKKKEVLKEIDFEHWWLHGYGYCIRIMHMGNYY